jgi:hypothetical protein
VDVNPFEAWPEAAGLPMPGQVSAAGASSQPVADSAPTDANAATEGSIPFEDFVLAAVGGLLATCFAASRRGRHLLLRVRQRIQLAAAAASRWPSALRLPSVGRQAGRALALLRMTLSLLHLW